MTPVVTTIEQMRAWPQHKPRAVVMTMGALHDGHLQLMREARRLVGESGQVVVTIFVNPLQFGPAEDFAKYPRQLDADVALCNKLGVDVVFAPTPEQMYPSGQPETTVVPGATAHGMEGGIRPGHFAGVATVVLKLLNIVSPNIALFGEKDFQQLAVIRTMVADLNVPVEIIGVTTQREADGLARSSRNVYLDEHQRSAAAAMPAALRVGQALAQGGGSVTDVENAVREALSGLDIDYVQCRANNLTRATGSGVERLLVAVRVGSTRLLDNCELRWGDV
jgi:pantoate--beta-alanine ligase